ncbi:hypothetical protein D9M68_808670 [compost metagenome]
MFPSTWILPLPVLVLHLQEHVTLGQLLVNLRQHGKVVDQAGMMAATSKDQFKLAIFAGPHLDRYNVAPGGLDPLFEVPELRIRIAIVMSVGPA